MTLSGPSLPPQPEKRKHHVEASDQRATTPDNAEKRRKVIGPAPPPALGSSSPTQAIGPSTPPRTTHGARNAEDAEEKASSGTSSPESDDFGPALPPTAAALGSTRILGPTMPPASLAERPSTSIFDTDPQYAEQEKKLERDEWMTMPPQADDLAARMDPTKLRARKFNSGRGVRGGPPSGTGGEHNVWTETGEQKQKRLANEVMGASAPATATSSVPRKGERTSESEGAVKRIKEHTEKTRGKSLMQQHKESGGGREQEDDPSKRAFDWEKDMAAGTKIGHKQRKELIQKAAGNRGRFSSGGFL